MAQDLTVNIKTTSDVPQAMDKAKTAAGSFDKQVQDIGTKFKNSFKDIALGFVAPMIILNTLIGAIGSAIQKAKDDAREGLDLIAKGETIFASKEESQLARFIKTKAATEAEQELVKTGREEMTSKFLTETEAGRAIMQKMEQDAAANNIGEYAVPSPKQLAMQKDMQDMALKAFLESDEGKKYKSIFESEQNSAKAGTFKGPEGFSNVIGVGSNPVLEKMTRQNEIMEEIKIILQEQSLINRGGQVPHPFTENIPLTMQKAGLS